MKTALDSAYEAYAARKQAERQAHMLRLRQELIASLPSHGYSGRAQGSSKHPIASAPRPRQSVD